MKEQLISLETARIAKEKGFDWPTNAFHSRLEEKVVYNLPSQSILQKWLRDVHKVYLSVSFIGPDSNLFEYRLDHGLKGSHWANGQWYPKFSGCFFNTYEEALEAGLLESLKLISQAEGE